MILATFLFHSTNASPYTLQPWNRGAHPFKPLVSTYKTSRADKTAIWTVSTVKTPNCIKVADFNETFLFMWCVWIGQSVKCLDSGRLTGHIFSTGWDYTFLQHVQTSCGVRSASCVLGTEGFFLLLYGGWCIQRITQLHLMLMLTLHGILFFHIFRESCLSTGKALPFINKTKQNKQTLGLHSASELYRPSDCHLSVKLVPTLADRGCHVVSATNPHGH
jgi:hypothetical protein